MSNHHFHYPSPAQVGAASAMATLGALPLGTLPEDAENEEENGGSSIYALSATAGAMVGGGLIGYVAAGDLRGAGTGALLTTGLAAFANAATAIQTPRRRALGVGLGIGGALAIAGSLYLAATRSTSP